MTGMRGSETQATATAWGTLVHPKLVQVIFNKSRQNVSRDGNANRFAVITGSRRRHQ
jgi:hypothetical protein